ncbi:histidine phosphatase family protein [Streptomyces sp. LUP30]|uniref:histidine phosphatase family protein n=1 Tax=Streptomyces sp. LUP30 TaxID=1890285 RepID=UPI0009A0445E
MSVESTPGTPVVIRFVRHGESFTNTRRLLSYRDADLPLTSCGRQQAAALADRLVGETTIFSSPLVRAAQTARILGRGAALVRFDEGLRELDVGHLDGRDDPRSWALHDSVLARWDAGDTAAAFPGGESLAEAAARILAALGRCAATRPSPLVVSHGGAIRAALLQISRGETVLRHLGNCVELHLACHVEGERIRAMQITREPARHDGAGRKECAWESTAGGSGETASPG